MDRDKNRDINKLISILLLVRGNKTAIDSVTLPPCITSLYAVNPLSQSMADKVDHYLKDNENRWILSGREKINTSMTLLIEKNEYIKEEHFENLSACPFDNTDFYYKIPVLRFINKKELNKYSWVISRDTFKKPSEKISAYHSNELRIIPTSKLRDANVKVKGKNYIISHPEYNSDHSIYLKNILISRKFKEKDNKYKAGPDDYDIFMKTHQQYFDDTVYCRQFVWPHSSYHTIRMDYIPSVIEGLKKGLGNSTITYYTLLYLIHFKYLDLAKKIVDLIPDHWMMQSAKLLNAVATISSLSGDYESSLNLLKQAYELKVDKSLIAKNYLKILILAEKYSEVKAFEDQYKEDTNDRIKDDFLVDYKKIFKENKGKTATVSLCVIVKNEQNHIERAIKSADQFCDEIIVIDTGSTDNSVEIAQKAGAKVFHYNWDDNFSSARNFAIEHANCDYIFFLDADEYISPFFNINLQVFKKLLPLECPIAYQLSIGHHLNDTDWLFLAIERGNFKEETRAVRIIPNKKEITYKGLINENPEKSLRDCNLPIYNIPETAIQILHEHSDRIARIKRKTHIYLKINIPDKNTIISAIKDFSLIGDVDNTFLWLNHFYKNQDFDVQAKIQTGLHIGKMLEYREPDNAENFYFDILKNFPGNRAIIRAVAGYLLRNNKMEKIKEINFRHNTDFQKENDREILEFNSYRALKYFLCNEIEKSAALISKVLDETPSDLFAQSVRFYILMKLIDIEGAVSALDYIMEILSIDTDISINSLMDILELVSFICDSLKEKDYSKERSIILQAAISIEEILKNNE